MRIKSSAVAAFLLFFTLALRIEPADSAECNSCHESTYAKAMIAPFRHAVFESSCVQCHINPGAAGPNANEHGLGFLPPRVTQIDVCNTCHKSTIFHPIGIVSRGKDIKMPDKLPTIDGVITCVTCHTPHAGDFKYLVWLDGDRDLCIQCHVAQVFVKKGRVCEPETVVGKNKKGLPI